MGPHPHALTRAGRRPRAYQEQNVTPRNIMLREPLKGSRPVTSSSGPGGARASARGSGGPTRANNVRTASGAPNPSGRLRAVELTSASGCRRTGPPRPPAGASPVLVFLAPRTGGAVRRQAPRSASIQMRSALSARGALPLASLALRARSSRGALARGGYRGIFLLREHSVTHASNAP